MCPPLYGLCMFYFVHNFNIIRNVRFVVNSDEKWTTTYASLVFCNAVKNRYPWFSYNSNWRIFIAVFQSYSLGTASNQKLFIVITAALVPDANKNFLIQCHRLWQPWSCTVLLNLKFCGCQYVCFHCIINRTRILLHFFSCTALRSLAVFNTATVVPDSNK